MYSRGEGARSSSLEMFASRFSEASEIPWVVRDSLFWLVLMDSAPDPIGRKTDGVRVEVPNVVLRCTGVRDDLGCADSTLRWEFLVVLVWVMVILEWIGLSSNRVWMESREM